MLTFKEEKMSAEFTKWKILGLPFDAVLHHFTDSDKGLPHDHPFGFHSKILFGGYTEMVYHLNPDGTWNSEMFVRRPHDSFFVAATHIHEIIVLPWGDCYTLVQPQEKTRESRFWNFDNDQAASRAWNEKEFKPYNKSTYEKEDFSYSS